VKFLEKLFVKTLTKIQSKMTEKPTKHQI